MIFIKFATNTDLMPNPKTKIQVIIKIYIQIILMDSKINFDGS